MTNDSSLPKITKDMTIAEIMEKYPETEEVMLEYGLHCVGCAINEFDTLEGGAEIHGMSPEETEEMLAELNTTLDKPRAYTNKHISVTEKAILKIINLRQETGAESDKVLVEVAEDEDGKREYFLELTEDKLPMHEEVLIGGIPFLFEKDSIDELQGLIIDYKSGFVDDGFTFRQSSSCGNEEAEEDAG